MSTKNSLFYNNSNNEYSHFYEELADGNYHFVKEQKTTVDLSLSIEEICCIAKSVDLQELKRQAFLSDDQIKDYAINFIKNEKSSNLFSSLWQEHIYGNNQMSLEDRVNKALVYYSSIRNNIRKTLELVENSRVHGISFGLEDIK